MKQELRIRAQKKVERGARSILYGMTWEEYKWSVRAWKNAGKLV